MADSDSSEPTVQQLFDLAGKVALVTGAAGYLGSRLASALAEAGASVVATSRQLARATELIGRLPEQPGQRHVALELDYLDESSIQQGFGNAIQQLGQVDVLVNNGHAPIAKDWKTVSHQQFTQQLANASGYFVLARLMRDHAVERRAPASVIMLGSMYGLVGSYPPAYDGICAASPVAYHTLKGGIAQMTRHLAVYWAADGVRVNTLCPGPFPDPERAPQDMVERLRAHVPLSRMGKPHELKGAAVFLASDASSYVTGQTLVVDGGWTAW